MMPAFDFVPGAAARAILPIMHRLNNRQPLIDEALVNQVGGDVILDARPDFIRVDKRKARTLNARIPRAEQQAAFVVEDVSSLHTDVPREIAQEVAVVNRLNGTVQMLTRQNVTEAERVRVNRAEQHIRQAALADLIGML